MSEQDDKKIDLALVFPAKGDSRRPPDWWGRGLLYAVIAVFLAIFAWRAWSDVSSIVLDVVIAVFIALAVEPIVIRLIRHGWKRGAASGLRLVGLMVLVVVLLSMFGNLFVQQMISMLKSLPDLYQQIATFVAQHSKVRLPEIDSLGDEILKNIQTSWLTDFAGQALNTTMGLFSFLLNLLTVVMVSFYISAAGPKLRRSMCRWLSPATQNRFLFTWTVVQNQISGFLFSRTILALLNAVFMAIFLEVINVPYWLPLALFCGIVSQFIPTVGTYIGGALPVVVAWGSQGILYAGIVLVYIIIYQQIENLILSPKISERTMDLNPAVAFLSVLVFGAIFGALGAFLALPITASLQVILKVYMRSYELVDNPLMEDPKPIKKSVVVKSADAINEHVIKPVSEHMPRAAKGTTARVSVVEDLQDLQDLRDLQEQAYGLTSQELDDSQTVAIPKGILDDQAKSGLKVNSGKHDTVDKSADSEAEQDHDVVVIKSVPVDGEVTVNGTTVSASQVADAMQSSEADPVEAEEHNANDDAEVGSSSQQRNGGDNKSRSHNDNPRREWR